MHKTSHSLSISEEDIQIFGDLEDFYPEIIPLRIKQSIHSRNPIQTLIILMICNILTQDTFL